ncbi:hypothetical protein L901_14615 [Agrobacterium sp. D14]|nr:hypothetical protein L901_14615 [Agrobacterium sp. D14]
MHLSVIAGMSSRPAKTTNLPESDRNIFTESCVETHIAR